MVGETTAFISNAIATVGQGAVASFVGQTILNKATSSIDNSEEQQKKYIEEKKKQANKEIAAANKKEVSIPAWMIEANGYKQYQRSL